LGRCGFGHPIGNRAPLVGLVEEVPRLVDHDERRVRLVFCFWLDSEFHKEELYYFLCSLLQKGVHSTSVIPKFLSEVSMIAIDREDSSFRNLKKAWSEICTIFLTLVSESFCELQFLNDLRDIVK